MPIPTRARRGLLAPILALVLGGCFAAAPSQTPTPTTGEPAPAARPVIIDADMDMSDLAAIAVLLRDPALDVRAIAIDGTGLVHCAGGRAVTRYLLDELGRPHIPHGCGREDGGPDANPFPADWRVVADDAYGLDIAPKPASALPEDAVTILTRAIDESPSAPTIIALGPWTNLEDAIAADPTVLDRVAGIHAMLGTVAAPGNVYLDGLDGDDPLEWNAYADPSAVEAVFATDVPIDLIPLDATDDVPVPADLPAQLDADREAAGADLLYELLLRHPARLAPDQGQQLWDELAALAVSQPDLVTWDQADLLVGADGRLIPDDAGRPVRFASAADPGATVDALLEGLRRGGPRATPFDIAGTIEITFDGTSCASTMPAGDEPAAGVYQLGYTGAAGTPGGVFVVGVDETASWTDLGTFVQGLSGSADVELPPWLIPVVQVVDEAGTGDRAVGTGTFADGPTYGPVCIMGTWPDLEFTVGAPFGG